MGICKECGQETVIGDWPFCPHGSVLRQRAQHFDPIVLHQAADGSYSFPASADAPLREGYRKVEIRTIQEADKISREMNSKMDSQLRDAHAFNEALHSATLAKHRADVDRIRDRLSARARELADGARAYVDGKRRPGPGPANFHFEVFAFDGSNREAHRDERTDWKSRRS